MCLRVEEQFTVLDVVGVRDGQVAQRQVGKVLRRLQHREVRIVDGQEGGQVVEMVARARLVQCRE